MTPQYVFQAVSQELFQDAEVKELLPPHGFVTAHYTSFAAARSILTNKEIWLSSPKDLNDIEEVIHRVKLAVDMINKDNNIKNLFDRLRYKKFIEAINICNEYFFDKKYDNTFIFSSSQHAISNQDGRANFWQTYAENGSGCAILFDFSVAANIANTGFVFGRVHYGSQHQAEQWIQSKIFEFCGIIQKLYKSNIDDSNIVEAAYALFDRMVLFSCFTKNITFEDEREWRLVYVSSRVSINPFDAMIDRNLNSMNAKIKFKLNITEACRILSVPNIFDRLVCQIIVGPTAPSHYADELRTSLVDAGLPSLVGKIVVSKAPLIKRT